MALAAGVDPSRLHRIPPGVDIPETRSNPRSERPTLITVARLEDRYKGHDVLVRAMPAILERVPGAQWLVVGDGSLRPELEQLVRRQGLERSVRFVGAVPDEHRDALLDRAHVFVMPSRLPGGESGGEGFGIAYMEAAAHELPVVAGNAGGALDAVVPDRTGLLADPTDPEAVAIAVAGLLLDRDRAAALGRAGAARARAFAWERIARRVEDLLLELAGGPG
jgi:phosphatidylinositol alpha-1,6-mannosyltransferase